MRSVRLDDELESRLQELSRETGEPVSEIIRRAVKAHCATLLGGETERQLSYYIGKGKSTKRSRAATPSNDTQRALSKILTKKHPRRRKATR